MKSIEIDDKLYAFIASQTQEIGESASDILHRLLLGEKPIPTINKATPVFEKTAPQPVIIEEPAAETQDAEQTKPVEQTADNSEQPSLFALLEKKGISDENSRVENFLLILSALHEMQGQSFNKVLDVKGRNRVYFSDSKEALLESGSSTNPKSIPDSAYWVVTNNNTAKKVSMLSQAMLTLGYANQDIEKTAAIFAPELQ